MLDDPPAAVRSICVTRSATMRRSFRRTLNAAGAEVEFFDDPGDAEPGRGQLVFVDGEVWRGAGASEFARLVADGGKLVVVGESIADDDLVGLLRNDRLDHVIGHRAPPDDAELLVTSVKLLSGDLFGLEKYLAWGITVREVEVRSYDDKREALAGVAAAARQVGARRGVVARIESATDELLMNALYDAPAAGDDSIPSSRATDTGRSYPPAFLRYACDGRHFAVSVQDEYGELHKRAILDHLSRARSEEGRPVLAEGRGAGLGIYLIISSATRFIANIAPKQRTEVICLFDLDQCGRRAPACARSVHIFTADDDGRSDAA